MRTSELQYELPTELIAQEPPEQRDASRLLVLDRSTGTLRHEVFARLPHLLPPKALLVMNDTRVLPARLYMARRSGGRVEGLFLRETEAGAWEIMLTASGRLKTGEELRINGSTRRLRLTRSAKAGVWFAEPVPCAPAVEILAECGHPPLPPYIRRGTQDNSTAGKDERERLDRDRYQTVYARRPGAVAAPTAGLHFTPAVLNELRTAGIETSFVTLHVGVGTFAPIRCDDLAEHEMHAEWYDCPAATAEAVNAAQAQDRPIVAIGTTSARVLETCADESGRVTMASGWTRLFIYPPYRFKVVEGMVTNFHLPGSTLLAMLFAFAGREAILNAYNEAIRERYRFYSYGDAMLVL
ncbi:MAG TPA: tRNA preQ1(34) S-adenosylmethionine ribosyltransferase-isomerase QueA [Phycisphaerae bacterium]|nr:tRNA preQ1(34) S-adenosylmethionine ribosyltransferase-isomerase QueA [Phycisphaerae bacterium]HRR86906.1 tRNA preQ1(34) S-adenosylmethionine ribosyltransferase-isomerase QueA [Phycisphaerae bacterium]